MRVPLVGTYIRGRLARRLLLVFVLVSVLPVLLASFVSYRQLMRGADAARARTLHDTARESALTFLSELQAASAELALVDPAAPGSNGSHRPWPAPFSRISFLPVGTRAQWRDALADVPERMRGPILTGRTVLVWTQPNGGRAQLSMIRSQPSRAWLARGTLDARRMIDQAQPTDPGTGIALIDGSMAAHMIRSDIDPVPRGVFQQMARADVNGPPTALWHSRAGGWRGSGWTLFLQGGGFASPPLRLLICERAGDSIAGLPQLRLTIPMTLLGAMAFAAWLAIAQLRRYLGPLETLTSATRKLGDSNFDVQVRIRTGDELSDLGDDFNRMAQRLRDQHHELQRQAQMDGLTRLTNRDFFHQRLRERLTLAERSALLYVDLDDFKKINDSAGHGAGDTLLREVAQRLRACVHPAETVARLGGDEFAVLLAAGAGASEAAAAASRILQAVEQPVLVSGTERRVSASIGIALIPDDGETADLLLRNADIAMYQAKGRGRNGMVFYSRDMYRKMEERLSLEIALQGAVAHNELRLHYQPIMSAGRLTGLEALVRWNRPSGEVGPGEFIPIAEQSGLILTIGAWVLGEACADFARWRTAGIAPGYVSVNVSPRQLQSSDLCAALQALLRKWRIRPEEIQLEMTESALADGTEIPATLARLHDSGVRLALDDFGTGYSSLGQLQRLPFDVVKIDRSFIVGLPENDIALQLVRTILRMTDSLDKLAVAEGVETVEQRDLLCELGCDAMQGYLFGRPMPERQIRSLLEAAADQAPPPARTMSRGA